MKKRIEKYESQNEQKVAWKLNLEILWLENQSITILK